MKTRFLVIKLAGCGEYVYNWHKLNKRWIASTTTDIKDAIPYSLVQREWIGQHYLSGENEGQFLFEEWESEIEYTKVSI